MSIDSLYTVYTVYCIPVYWCILIECLICTKRIQNRPIGNREHWKINRVDLNLVSTSEVSMESHRDDVLQQLV